MGRTVIILLALSLAANVFLGGFVAGRIAGPGFAGFDRGFGEGPHRDRGRGGDFRRDFDALPDAAREKLRASFKKNREEFITTFREGRALQQEFVGVLTAETFDRSAAEAVAAKIEAFEAERRRSTPRLIIDVMDGLPVEDRRALAKVIERRIIEDMRGPGRRHRRDGPPDDGPVTE
ncbi:MAG: periplasmic heavy metal sensor [Parvularculaceae bacterium]|nr:periplasmic heavy metal sensor [Parvularculaceae bacterium]